MSYLTKLSRSPRLINFRVSAALVTLASMFLTVPASATNYSQTCRVNTASCVGGTITVHNDQTNWNFTIKDNKVDGNCAYAKIVIDRSLAPDKTFESPRACGNGTTVSWTGNKTESRTVGARVYACVDRNLQPDSCDQAFYESER